MGGNQGAHGDGIGCPGAPSIKAEPSGPQQPRAYEDEREIVRSHVVGSPATASPQHHGAGQGGGARVNVHDRSSGKIQGPQLAQPPASPEPMSQRTVDKDRP